MSHRGGLAFYVTSHGFGHLNRSCAVINKIPLDVPVTIRSRSPQCSNMLGSLRTITGTSSGILLITAQERLRWPNPWLVT